MERWREREREREREGERERETDRKKERRISCEAHLVREIVVTVTPIGMYSSAKHLTPDILTRSSGS